MLTAARPGQAEGRAGTRIRVSHLGSRGHLPPPGTLAGRRASRTPISTPMWDACAASGSLTPISQCPPQKAQFEKCKLVSIFLELDLMVSTPGAYSERTTGGLLATNSPAAGRHRLLCTQLWAGRIPRPTRASSRLPAWGSLGKAAAQYPEVSRARTLRLQGPFCHYCT